MSKYQAKSSRRKKSNSTSPVRNSGFVKGVVLPLQGEPHEIDIPSHFTRKSELISHLSRVSVYRTSGYDYNDEIELGLYWRNILTDYKKTPRTCIIFRFSKGTVLPENQYCQYWRADPWKKTYGPIVILKIQDGNTQFKYMDYKLTDYHKQCFYNVQQQKEAFASTSMTPKNYLINLQHANLKNPDNIDFKQMFRKPYHTVGPVTRRQEPLKIFGTKRGKVRGGGRGGSGGGVGHVENMGGKSKSPSSSPLNKGSYKKAFLEPNTEPIRRKSSNNKVMDVGDSIEEDMVVRQLFATDPDEEDTISEHDNKPYLNYARGTTADEKKNAKESPKKKKKNITTTIINNSLTSKSFTLFETPPQEDILGSTEENLEENSSFIVAGESKLREGSKFLDMDNIQEKSADLLKLVKEEEKLDVDILSSYLQCILVRAFSDPKLKMFVSTQSNGYSLIDTGLYYKDKNNKRVYCICYQINKKSISLNQLAVEQFVTWNDAVKLGRGLEDLPKPNPVRYDFQAFQFIDQSENNFIDLNLNHLYDNQKQLFPKEWKDLSIFHLRLVLRGITYNTVKMLKEDPTMAVRGIFNQKNALHKLFLIPIFLDDTSRPSFCVAVSKRHKIQRASTTFLEGSAILRISRAYSVARCFQKPNKKWIYC